jgi:hypothetical protein
MDQDQHGTKKEPAESRYPSADSLSQRTQRGMVKAEISHGIATVGNKSNAGDNESKVN